MRRVPYVGIWAGLLSVGLLFLGRLDRGLVERVYSQGAYPWIARVVSSVSGAIPFALAEVAVVAIVVFGVWRVVRRVRTVRRAGRTRRWAALAAAATSLTVIGWTATGAIWLYGFNLDRRSTDQLWQVRSDVAQAEIERLIADVGRRVDALRVFLPEDGRGVVRMPSDLRELDAHLVPVQARALADAGLPRIGTGRAKRQLFGGFARNYATGYFSPLTLEPTLAWPPFPTTLPSVAAHERAHLSGFAYEDEASFVGFLTTIGSGRADVRYSGWLDLWLRIGRDSNQRSAAVQRDIAAYLAAARAARGPGEETVQRAQDVLLKASGQPEGLGSYALVVVRAFRYLATYGFPADQYDR
jgi:hypothetical protein